MDPRAFFLSAKVVIRDESGRVLILQRSASSKNHGGLWEFPGGKTDPGETFDAGLLREVTEETGLKIALERVAGAGNSEVAGKTIAYLFMEARWLAGEVRLSDEHEASRWVSLAELLTVDLCPQFLAFAEDYCRKHGYVQQGAQPSVETTSSASSQLDAWVSEYRAQKPLYEELARVTVRALRGRLGPRFMSLLIDGRAKAIASFAEKIMRKHKYQNPLREITDLCGLRIITQIRSEVEAVCAFIRENFQIDEANSSDALTRLKHAEFGYRSVHYVAQLKEGVFRARGELLPLKMEIQVRTIVEHAWADVAHDRLYKSGFNVPAPWKRESARVAAALESADDAFQRIVTGMEEYRSHFGAYLTEKQIREEMVVCETVLRHEPGNSRQAVHLARLALSLDEWDRVDQIASVFPGPKPGALLLCQGTALCSKHQAEPSHADLLRGRKLLREAAAHLPDDSEPLLRLAETTDDPADRLAYLTKAFALAPADPAVLSAYARQKIATERDVSFLPLLRPSIEAAMQRCERQVEAGVNLPLAHFQLAFFQLLLCDETGTASKALNHCILAVRRLQAPSLLDSALRTARDLRACFGEPRRDVQCVLRFLIVAHRARFPGAPLPSGILEPSARPLPGGAARPVVILSGGCSPEVKPRLPAFRALLDQGLHDFAGTIICGGTREGVSGLAGELFGQTSERRAQVIGYIPSTLVTDGTATPDDRCHEIRRTDDKDTFSILEPLQAWADILATGIAPRDVRLLGMNGGAISMLEYRVAWALGAAVGILRDSGREADRLQQAVLAGGFPGILLLPQDAMTLRAYAGNSAPAEPLFTGEVRDRLARQVHAHFLQENRYRNPDPAMQPWEGLRDDLRQSNLDHVECMTQILAAAGFVIVPGAGELEIPGFDTEIERMAEMEHGRWNVERLRSGWRYGAERDPAGKINPCIVSWRDLPNKDHPKKDPRIWDRDNVRNFVRHLAEIGLKAVRK